ncbi:MAG: hypothetical protein IT331_23335 [Anaerolineae bacterium]|nr:hypothetical protein [Anaerolineae bacterium]
MAKDTDKHQEQTFEQDATDNDESENETEETFASDDTPESEMQEATAPIRTQSKTTKPDAQLSRSFQRKSSRDDEPYDFERCTVLVLLQLMPLREGQLSDARKVFISARTHSYPPQVTQMLWDELAPRLPNEIKTLFERLQQDLPQRAAEQHATEEAERQRQAQLQADSEKRRAAKKEKASSHTNASVKQSPQKRPKKIDLNVPPALPDKNEKEGAPSQVAGVQIMTNNIEPEPIAPSAQMTMF